MKVGEYPEAEALGKKLVLDDDRQLRVDALRAASRVVAGTFKLVADTDDPTARNITHATLVCAAQFHRWLKDG